MCYEVAAGSSLLDLSHERKGHAMPRKTVVAPQKAPTPKTVGHRKVKPKDEWAGYVQCSIDGPEKEAFDLWLSENPTAMPALLIDSLASGLKLTLVWDGANECFIATLTGRPDIEGEREWTASLSARAGDMNTALSVLVYKHVEICGEDWVDWLVNGTKTKRSFG